MFRLYDIDHDKKISQEEMKNVIDNLFQAFHHFKEDQSRLTITQVLFSLDLFSPCVSVTSRSICPYIINLWIAPGRLYAVDDSAGDYAHSVYAFAGRRVLRSSTEQLNRVESPHCWYSTQSAQRNPQISNVRTN